MMGRRGAFELSFHDGEAALRVPGRGSPEPAVSFTQGASPSGKAPVDARAEDSFSHSQGALGLASGDFGDPPPPPVFSEMEIKHMGPISLTSL